MKILYIAPENVVGNLNLWQKIHWARGNTCRYVTYFPSRFGYPEDICLHLPWVAPSRSFLALREFVYAHLRRGSAKSEPLPHSRPPLDNRWLSTFFKVRDELWRAWVEPAIHRHGLLDFDVYHLETGLEFYRNGSFVRRLVERGKPIVNTFHGVELRTGSPIDAIDRHVSMHFTSELDLLPRHPLLRPLLLPIEAETHTPRTSFEPPLVVCHATRNRFFKGSDLIIETCERLAKRRPFQFLLIENQSHERTLQLKSRAHVYIDQVANVAPGYGMSSLESLCLGQVCMTNMTPEWNTRLPGHPFVEVTSETLESVLAHWLDDPSQLERRGREGRAWVRATHGLDVVGSQLYRYYQELGIE